MSASLPADAVVLEKEATQSTNDDLRALAEHGAPNLSCVWAHQQLKGRGRHGRVWNSPPGNVYCSILFRPQRHWPEVPQLVYVVALAVHEALHAQIDPDQKLEIKWPNDILLNGGKLTGMLLEASAPAERGSALPAHVIAGIGINLRHAPDASQALYPPTSLVAQGQLPPDPALLVQALRQAVAVNLQTWLASGFEPLRQRFLQRAHRLGQCVRLGTTADKQDYQDGVFEGIDEQGQLLLRRDDASLLRLYSGDVLMTS